MNILCNAHPRRFLRYLLWLLPAVALSASLIFASYRQAQAEAMLEQSKLPGGNPIAQLELAYRAYQLDPLERRIRTALPVLLDGALRAAGPQGINTAFIDQVFALSDVGGHMNTAALVGKSQVLLETNPGDLRLPGLLADLERGSTRVAAAYAIHSRFDLLAGRFQGALNRANEGLKYTQGVSAIPDADKAIAQNLASLKAAAQAGIEALDARTKHE